MKQNIVTVIMKKDYCTIYDQKCNYSQLKARSWLTLIIKSIISVILKQNPQRPYSIKVQIRSSKKEIVNDLKSKKQKYSHPNNKL